MLILKKFYKYCRFDVIMLNMVMDYGFYYVNLCKLNDLLDCEFVIEVNISLCKLVDFFKVFMGLECEDYWNYEVGCVIYYVGEEGDIKVLGEVRDYLKCMLVDLIGIEICKEFDI